MRWTRDGLSQSYCWNPQGEQIKFAAVVTLTSKLYIYFFFTKLALLRCLFDVVDVPSRVQGMKPDSLLCVSADVLVRDCSQKEGELWHVRLWCRRWVFILTCSVSAETLRGLVIGRFEWSSCLTRVYHPGCLTRGRKGSYTCAPWSGASAEGGEIPQPSAGIRCPGGVQRMKNALFCSLQG